MVRADTINLADDDYYEKIVQREDAEKLLIVSSACGTIDRGFYILSFFLGVSAV
jgi:hypothetical protein